MARMNAKTAKRMRKSEERIANKINEERSIFRVMTGSPRTITNLERFYKSEEEVDSINITRTDNITTNSSNPDKEASLELLIPELKSIAKNLDNAYKLEHAHITAALMLEYGEAVISGTYRTDTEDGKKLFMWPIKNQDTVDFFYGDNGQKLRIEYDF